MVRRARHARDMAYGAAAESKRKTSRKREQGRGGVGWTRREGVLLTALALRGKLKNRRVVSILSCRAFIFKELLLLLPPTIRRVEKAKRVPSCENGTYMLFFV